MTGLGHKLEIAANAAIVLVAIVVVITIYKGHSLTAAQRHRPPEIAIGATAPVQGWSAKQNMLVFALSTQCHFCKESAPFYKRLADTVGSKRDLHLVALLPQPINESKDYLKQMGIQIADVRQVKLGSIPVVGTPTLLLLDPYGKVLKKWNGKLIASEEETVWKSLGCTGPEKCS